MPLVRIDVPAGTAADRLAALGEAVQEALHAALGVPMAERFQVITEHRRGGLVVDPSYLGIRRGPGAIIIQVFLNAGRDTDTKRAFYRALADGLQAKIGLRREDVTVSLVEVARDDWSFGHGEAQLVAKGPKHDERERPSR